MADIQDTDLFLVNRNNSTASLPASELMADILDDDLMLVNRGGKTYKVTGLEVKDSLGPTDEPPSMTGATLTGTGPQFSGQTYTTTLQNYNPGVPEADQTMLAKVTGALSVVGETSAITGSEQLTYLNVPAETNTDINGDILPAIRNATPVGKFSYGNHPAGTLFDGELTTACSFVNTLTGAQSFEIDLAVIGAEPGDELGIYNHNASDPPSYQNWSIQFLDSNLNNVGSYIDLTSSTTPQWEDFTVPANAARVKFYPRLLSTDYCQARLYAFRINQGPALVQGDSKILTLTNRTDLDNDVFQPGDVVKSGNPSGIQLSLVDQAGYAWYDENQVEQPVGTASNIVSQNFFNSNLNDTNKQGNKGFYFNEVDQYLEFSYSGATIGEKITFVLGKASSAGDTRTTYLQVDGNVVETGLHDDWVPTTSLSKDTLPKISFELTTTSETGTFKITSKGNQSGQAANIYWHYWTGGTPEVTVVSISQSSPEMTVSGGDWEIGETVKNTVARPPLIIPETDEITGYGTPDITMPVYSNGTLDSETDNFPGGMVPGLCDVFFAKNESTTIIEYLNITNFTGNVNSIRLFTAATPDAAPGDWTNIYGLTAAEVADWGTEVANRKTGEYILVMSTNDSGITRFSETGTCTVEGSPTLTFASNKDLANFSPADDVVQDSGYTPETSEVTNVSNSVTPIYSNFLTTSTTWSGSYTPDKAFNGVMDGDGGSATNGTATVKYTHPEIITVTKLEMRSYSGLDVTLPDGTTTTCPGIGGQEIWSEIDIPNGSFEFTGTNFISFNYPPGTTYFDGFKLNGVELIDSQSSTVLTLTDDKDLENFRIGDAVSTGSPPDNALTLSGQHYIYGGPAEGTYNGQDAWNYLSEQAYFNDNVNDVNKNGNKGLYTSINSISYSGLPVGTKIQICAGAASSGAGSTDIAINLTGPVEEAQTTQPGLTLAGAGLNKDSLPKYILEVTTTSNSGTFTMDNGTAYFIYWIGVATKGTGTISNIGDTSLTLSNASGWETGDKATGPYIAPASGVVASTSGTEMSLSSSTGRWISNAGKYVIGSEGPATSVTAYLKWENNNVTEVVSSDPGFLPAPPNNELYFGDPAPTGDTWDEEFPAGTYIATKFEADNAVGRVESTWSDSITPRSQAFSADPQEAFAERALRLLTFENRKHVYCGQQAEAKRDASITYLVEAGYNLDEILKYL